MLESFDAKLIGNQFGIQKDFWLSAVSVFIHHADVDWILPQEIADFAFVILMPYLFSWYAQTHSQPLIGLAFKNEQHRSEISLN